MAESLFFTAEHEMLRQSVRDFVNKELVPNADAWEEERLFPDWVFRRLGELGYLGLHFPEEYGGRGMIRFTDPEGQRLALIDASDWPGGSPWRESPVPAEFAIRGIAFVALVVRDLGPTEAVLRDVLGFRRAAERALDGHRRIVFETGPGGPGAEVHVEVRPELPRARTGIGGVHHVAFRTPTDEQHRQWRERVAVAGLAVTPVIDRYYFRSLYFREPGGVLFEIATDGPGFAVDEDPAHLGERLALPPFLEPYRAQIEAGLRPLVPAEQGH